MKKITVLLLVLVLLLGGCSTAEPIATEWTEETEPTEPIAATEAFVVTEPPTTTELPAVTELVTTTEPAEVTEPVTTTEPIVTAEPTTERPTVPAAPTTKPALSTKPSETKPTQPVTEPTEIPEPTENTVPDSYPAASDNNVLFFMENTINIAVGNTGKADYIYYGSGKLRWYVSHPKNIRVDENGEITPIYGGNYEVYVTDGQYTSKTDVFVPHNWQGCPHGMYFESHTMEMTAGTSRLLSVVDIFPEGAAGYTSSDPSVAQVSGSYITAVAPGNTIITAYNEGYIAKMILTVVPPVTAVTIDIQESSVGLYDDKTVQLNHTYTGTGCLEWSSSNSYVARVEENGLVTAVGEGSCWIYLSDGVYADKCRITVTIDPNIKVTKLEVTSANGILYDGVTRYKGDYITFKVRNTPADASEATYLTVSDSKVIAVTKSIFGSDVTFRLDFKKAGTCVLKIHSGDHAVTNTYTIHVKEDYDGNPGPGLLTPEQFVDCYNHVLNANGMSQEIMPTGYLVLTLDPDELTWKQARGSAEGLSHHWWLIGKRHMILTYEGTNEYGQHIFYERGC